ncbi:Alpha/Beta hydrolase protein [Lipomyces mesembrius]
MVKLSGKDRALNEFSVERVGEKADKNLVILHGYGAGLEFFYKTFEPLSRVKGWHLYALDMLGMGRSTRPQFKIRMKNRQDAVKEAEDWFIDALEEWRVEKKIDRFTLMGHSMGGYMAVAYALKYPGHLNKLILASPVGIPEDPYAVIEALPEPSESAIVNAFTQDQEEVTSGDAGRVFDNNNVKNARSAAAKSDPPNRPPRQPLPRLITYLWDSNGSNLSPFSLVRWSGPVGPRLVSGWTSRRFSHLPASDAAALHDYSYSIFRLRGSGEYALTYILAPGIRANASDSPVGSALSSSPTPRRENGIPVVFVYGDHDWMDVSGGHAAKEKLEEEKRRALKDASPKERQADNGSAKVIIMNNAGHHLYLDNWEEFNEAILN